MDKLLDQEKGNRRAWRMSVSWHLEHLLDKPRLYEDRTVVSILFPLRKEEPLLSLKSGKPAFEEVLDLSDFSTRLQTVLMDKNLTTFGQILSMRLGVLLSLGRMGRSSVLELLRYCQSALIMAADAITEENLRIGMQISAGLSAGEQKALGMMIHQLTAAAADPLQSVENAAYLLRHSRIFLYFSAIYLYGLIDMPMTRAQMAARLSPAFAADFFECSLRSLLLSCRLRIYNDVFLPVLPRLAKWIRRHPGRDGAILKERLSGSTLEDLSRLHHLSRERIRQIFQSTLELAYAQTSLHLYGYWFERYELDARAAAIFFEMDEREWTAMQLMAPEDTERMDPVEIVHDPMMDGVLFERWRAWKHRDDVYFDGSYVPATRRDLLRAMTHFHCQDEARSLTEFLGIWQVFLLDTGLSHRKDLQISNTTTLRTLLRQENWVISSGKGTIRYYESSLINWHIFARALNLQEWNGQEISTAMLFARYEDIMESYDLHNPEELHNILRRTYPIWQDEQPRITFGRCPILCVGEADRKKQMIALLEQMVPVSRDEFVQAYQERYGVSEKSLRANYLPLIEQYFEDGRYRLDLPQAQAADLERLSALLPGDFYAVDTVRTIARESGQFDDLSVIHAGTLRQIGFRTLSGYILRGSWPSAQAYFKSAILEKQEVDLDAVHPDFRQAPAFYQPIYSLRSSLEIIETDERHYEHWNVFAAKYPAVSKRMLKEYVWQSERFARIHHMEPYNDFSLRRAGFVHGVYLAGLNSHLLDILRKNIRKTPYVLMGGIYVFTPSRKSRSGRDLLFSLLEGHEGCTSRQLSRRLMREYGVCMKESSLEERLRQAGAHVSGHFLYTSEDIEQKRQNDEALLSAAQD